MKSIIVLAASSQQALDEDGAAAEDRHCLTLKEAKVRAAYYMTATYAKMTEMSEPFGYARVLVNGENVFDIGE